MNAAELARPDSDSEADALLRCAAHHDHADDFLATRGKARTPALPLLDLTGPVVALDPGSAECDGFAARLRAGDPPAISRI